MRNVISIILGIENIILNVEIENIKIVVIIKIIELQIKKYVE